jgi:AcrR family transcriptional regulator
MGRSLFLMSVPAPRDWDDARATSTSIARARICEAMARVAGERGYAAATIGEIVKTAGISRRTFYEHFKDKEECFVEMYRTGCENGIAEQIATVRALENPDWRARLRVSLETYLSHLADEPHFARVLLIEVLGAGPRALAMREQILAAYVTNYRTLHALAKEDDPELPDVPETFLRGLVGGIAELVQQCLLESTEEEVSERLRALAPTLVSFATTVLTGGGERGRVPIPQGSRSTQRQDGAAFESSGVPG